MNFRLGLIWDHGPVRWPSVAAAASAGVVLGVFGRNTPLALALAVLPSADIGSCGMEEVLACTFENLPAAFAKLFELALLVLLLCAVLAALGALSLAVGAGHLWRTSRPRPPAPAERPYGERREWLAPILVGTGTCLLTPVLWLLGSFLVFLVRNP